MYTRLEIETYHVKFVKKHLKIFKNLQLIKAMPIQYANFVANNLKQLQKFKITKLKITAQKCLCVTPVESLF